MKRALKYLSVVLIAASFGACEDVVQVELDRGAKLYVIDAFISDDPGSKVIRITTTDAYFSNSAPPPVEGATVVLNDLATGQSWKYDDLGNGAYAPDGTQDLTGNTGHQYELLVTIEGDTYRSLSVQNRKAGIDTIVGELIDGNGGFGPPPAVPFYFCSLFAKDPSGPEADHYWIKTFRNDSLLFNATDINICIDGTGGPIGGNEGDSSSFTPPATFLGFRQFYSGNTCKVEIHSISRDTYHFFRQAAGQVNNAGLFATTPENLKTNIVSPANAKTRAIGWFNVAGVSSMKVTLP